MEYQYPMRINKYLAHKGYATRRGADELISGGKVFVNNTRAVIGQKIQQADTVEVRNIPKTLYRYVLYNKARGIITHSPERDEVDIVTQIKNTHSLEGLFPIGRLDKDSEGLMLLTDDGRVTERLLNPDNAHEREYEVSVDKKITGGFMKQMEAGVKIERYKTKPTTVKKINDTTFSLLLTEGKKHQIRRMCAALGYQVRSLKRTRILNLHIQGIKSNGVRELTKTERDRFFKTIGLV